MKKNHLVKTSHRFIVATLDNPTQYLRKNMDEYSFTDNIIYSTKCVGLEAAYFLKLGFIKQFKKNNIELVIIPLNIDYSLVEDTDG